MIDLNCPMSWLTSEPPLIARCLLSGKPKTVIKNALVLSRTAKIYNSIINSDLFFKIVIQLIDPTHPFNQPKSESNGNAKPFNHKFFEIRDPFLKKEERFRGERVSSAMANEEGVEVISFAEGIVSFKLKEGSPCNSIKIPDNLRVPERQAWRHSPCTARSEKYLAINNRCDSAIYIYTPDGKKFLARHEVCGEILQLEIKGDLLYVVELFPGGVCNLIVFKLLSLKPVFLKMELPNCLFRTDLSRSICIGEEYLICRYSDLTENRLYFLPISCVHDKFLADNCTNSWFEGPLSAGFCYLFPNGKDFIEVVCNHRTFDIAKITFAQDSFLKTVIANNIVIPINDKAIHRDVCFHNDRLVVAYIELKVGTTFFSYDLLSGQVVQFYTSSHTGVGNDLTPHFLSAAQNIYYLMMDSATLGQNQGLIQSNLITFAYGKI